MPSILGDIGRDAGSAVVASNERRRDRDQQAFNNSSVLTQLDQRQQKIDFDEQIVTQKLEKDQQRINDQKEFIDLERDLHFYNGYGNLINAKGKITEEEFGRKFEEFRKEAQTHNAELRRDANDRILLEFTDPNINEGVPTVAPIEMIAQMHNEAIQRKDAINGRQGNLDDLSPFKVDKANERRFAPRFTKANGVDGIFDPNTKVFTAVKVGKNNMPKPLRFFKTTDRLSTASGFSRSKDKIMGVFELPDGRTITSEVKQEELENMDLSETDIAPDVEAELPPEIKNKIGGLNENKDFFKKKTEKEDEQSSVNGSGDFFSKLGLV